MAGLYVNDRQVAEISLSEEWTTTKITIPSYATLDGLNALNIIWPPGSWDGTRGVELVASAMEAGILVDMLPAFADVHALNVVLGSSPATCG